MTLDLEKLKEIAGRAFVVSFHDEGGVYIGDVAASQITALIGELEKAREERDDARQKRDRWQRELAAERRVSSTHALHAESARRELVDLRRRITGDLAQMPRS